MVIASTPPGDGETLITAPSKSGRRNLKKSHILTDPREVRFFIFCRNFFRQVSLSFAHQKKTRFWCALEVGVLWETVSVGVPVQVGGNVTL